MKVLLINGSPHQYGCTYTALNEVAEELEHCEIETEILHIGTRPIGGCIACGVCRKIGKCVFPEGESMRRWPRQRKRMALSSARLFITHPATDP